MKQVVQGHHTDSFPDSQSRAQGGPQHGHVYTSLQTFTLPPSEKEW